MNSIQNTIKLGKSKGKSKKKSIINLGILSGLAATSIAVAAVATSCSGVAYKSTAQVVVSDSTSILADQSFSESTYNGLKEFYEGIGIQNVPSANDSSVVEGNGIWKRPGSDDLSRISTYTNISSEGSNIIIATGYNQQTALQMVTDSSLSYGSLNNTGFIFVDGAMSTSYGENKTSDPKNVASISYRADDGSFLVGIATAVYLNENWNAFYTTKPTEIPVSGFVGLALPSTISFLNGFRQGLMYWNQVASMIQLSDNQDAIKMKWISPSNSNFNIDAFTSGSFDANEQQARQITQNLITEGAKVILPIAGPQTRLTVNTVLQSNTNVAVLGVDTAQENITDLQQKMPKPTENVQNIVPFSSLKNLTASVKGVLESIKSGENKGLSSTEPGYSGFGYNNIADLSNNGVGISEAGLPYLIDPLFFTENPKDSETGKIDGKTEGDKTTYDLTSIGSTKWKLSDLKRGNEVLNPSQTTTGDQQNNYQKVLSDKVLFKYANTSGSTPDTYSWKINGDELSKSLDDTLFPKITATSGNTNNVYTISSAFGGEQTIKIATSETLLDGTKWTYNLSLL